MKAGFLGLGAMGLPMARNLAKAGHLQAVWNRTSAKAQALAEELGVVCASSPAELAAQVDAMMVCVSADEDMRTVIDALLPGLRKGAIVVDHSTVSVTTACDVALQVESHGGFFLDAPVTGGVEGAIHGTLAIMVGGDAHVLGRISPLLETMARRVVHFGPVGSGQGAKAVNQIMAAGINQAVCEALALGEKLALDMAKVIEVVGSGAAGNWFLDKRGMTMTEGSYKPGFKLKLHHKDLRICLNMAEHLDASLPLTQQTLQDYAVLMERGYGDEDISALYRLKSISK